MSKNNLITIIILILIATGAAGFFVWRATFRSSTSDVESPKTSDVFPRNVEEGGLPETNESTILEILAKQALNRTIPAGDVKITKELKDLSLQLSREPNYLQGWLQVGILRKFLQDYDGAILAWQYASLIRPNNYIAFNNLADLYYYYLKDFPKAEAILLEGISKNPKNADLMALLASLYKDQGDKPNARKYYEELNSL